MAIVAPAPARVPHILAVNCDQTKEEFVKAFNDVPTLFRNLFTGYLSNDNEPSSARPTPEEEKDHGWELCCDGTFYFKGFDVTKYTRGAMGVWPNVQKEPIDCIIVGGSSKAVLMRLTNSVNDIYKKDPENTLYWLKALGFWLTATAIMQKHINSSISSPVKISSYVGLALSVLVFTYERVKPQNIQMFHYEMAEPLLRVLDEAREDMSKKQRMFKYHLWGATKGCGNEGSVVFYDESDDKENTKQIRILTFQGHPELTHAMVRCLIKLFSAEGNDKEAVSKEEAADAYSKLDKFEEDKATVHWKSAAGAMWKVATGTNFE
ncbi:hypothetical protein CONPUDRAFT_70787 [Coniophora puteana RWD-64-598 SS2]|uniref:Class I glutamine amidotransferase-like protein n=1 Tax=Coniophora puteana (strain RWD-64-598) TaxID=741705 RepID=A0A5M3MXV7_CONPW|nr:uncharacterized protein CONPUDRAFT_70787 [Coniophora puteana RWD-64-598 SS2]EIW83866.1 hypothetical protein CONPUDRAFT_70787 [Coniophora puteana RWD-64-598 SS2]